VVFAEERTCQPAPRVGLLLLLKTFQRLGYFVPYAEIPPSIVSHMARCAGYPGVPEGMMAYDASTARDRHMALVRAFVGVMAYGHAARQIIVAASLEAARTWMIWPTSSTWLSRNWSASVMSYRRLAPS
jgi:hypothetical protein